MLTRRTALGLLPAGALLDANFISSAQAQTTSSASIPIPDVLLPNAKNILVINKPGTTEPTGFGLTEFVRIAAEKEIGLQFKAELDATQKIIEFLAKIFDQEFSSKVTSNSADYIQAIKNMASPVEDLLTARYNSLMRVAEPPPNKRPETFFQIYKYYYMLQLTIGYFPNRSRPGDVVRPKRLIEMSEDICAFLEKENAKVRKKNVDVLTLPSDILDKNPNWRKERSILQDAITAQAEKLINEGFNIAAKEILQYHAAMFAYGIYSFLLKVLLLDPRVESTPQNTRLNQELAKAYCRNLELARARTSALLNDAFDFFVSLTAELIQESATIRTQLNELPAMIYVGSSAEAPITIKAGYTSSDETKYPDVKFANFYLELIPKRESELLQGRIINDEKKRIREKFVAEAAANGAVCDVGGPNDTALVFGDQENYPPYRFPIFRFAGVRIRSSAEIDPKNEDPSLMNDRKTLGSSVPSLKACDPATAELRKYLIVQKGEDKQAFERGVERVVRLLNDQIDEIKRRYRVQVRFNCEERMTWSFLEMLARG